MNISYSNDVNMQPEWMKQWIVENCNCSLGNASQVCNDIIAHPGDVGGAGGYTRFTCMVGGSARRVYHASAGAMGGTTCTAFFVEYPANVCHIVALGCHTGPSSYEITYKKDCWTHGNNVNL